MEKHRALIDKLDRVRDLSGLSQDYMTTAMGVTRNWWYHVARRGQDPALSKFVKAANVLGFEVVLWPTNEDARKLLETVNGSTPIPPGTEGSA